MTITFSKRKKLYIYFIYTLVIILLVTAFFFYYDYAKKKKMVYKTRMDYYNSMVQSEQKWLASLQQSNGALAFTGKENGTVSIIPYFSSITAIALLQKAPDLEYADEVKDYFEWYFAHLNNEKSDKNGTAGTIYNYRINVENGVVISEINEQVYDSVDSYAALFLIALWNYYEQTGDKEYLIAYYWRIKDVIGAMNATIDTDGLSKINPNSQVKYLMDNAEISQGLSSTVNLLEQVILPHFKKGTTEYSDVKQLIAHFKEIKIRQEQAFETMLWNEAEQRYEIGINDTDKVFDFKGWNQFYPDAAAQLFPIVFGVIDPDSERAGNLYHTFGEYFEWENMAHYEKGDTDFYWGLTAYCGALMEDEEKVRAYLDYYKKMVAPNHEYPVYNADAAWVVLASAEMARFYQEQMQRIDPLGIVLVQ